MDKEKYINQLSPVLHLRPSSYGWNGFHTLLP
jgi:hypothetical protein